MHIRLSILLLFIACGLQAQQYVFMQWGTDDGLPTSTINDIAEDPRGFIWLATDGAGLVRFDGKKFSQPNALDSLPSPFVTVIEVDNQGNFWIGTERGAAYYNGTELMELNLPEALKTRVNAIAIDANNDAYIATRNGLFVYRKDEFEIYEDTEGLEINSLYVENLEREKTEVFYTSEQGFAGTIAPSNTKQTEGINKIIRVEDEQLLVGDSGTFIKNTDKALSNINAVRDAIKLEKSYWLADGNGGIEIVTHGRSMYLNNANGLAFDRVRCLYKAKNGDVWVGSLSGLSKLTSPYIVRYTGNQGLNDERVHTSFIDSKQNIWIGTASGISRISDVKTENYSRQEGIPPGLVLAIAETPDGTIWMGSEGGVAYYNNQTFTPINISNSFVFSLAVHRGNVYIGTASKLLKYANNSLTTVNGDVGFIQLAEKDEELWGVSLSGKLFNIKKNGLEPINQIGGAVLDSFQIRQFSVSSNGFVALSTEENGVLICSENKYATITSSSGLSSNILKAICATNEGVWIATDNALQHLRITDNEPQSIRLVDDQSGFLTKTCNERGLTFAYNNVLASTNDGLYIFDANKFVEDKPNQVFITAVDLYFNQNTNWGTFADSILPWSGLPDQISLKADQNYLTFHFASPSTNGRQLYQRYTLEGQDNTWTMAEGRQEAIYTDINPGKYTFIIEQANTPDFVNATSSRLPVIIVPPFYRTWWFWTALVFALSALVFFVVRYRINQLNARLALETALADSERKALRLQMNPHFVFNALDAISGFIFKNEPKEAVKYLTSFAKLMRLTLDSSRQTGVVLQNEIQLLKNYITLEQLRFGNSFDYNIEVDEEIDEYEENIPPMLLQPIVENAILHGLRHKKDERGTLLIHFFGNNEQLICEVKDDGIGRKKSAEINAKRIKKSSLATSITQERIALISKSLGKPVTFKIEDLQKADGTPAGTLVRITFPHLVDDEDA